MRVASINLFAPVLLLLGVAGARSEEFFLTGLEDMGEASRAMIYSLPSAVQFTLKQGEEAAGVKLIRLDSKNGFALARRGTNWLYLQFATDRQTTTGYGRFLLTGELPPGLCRTLARGLRTENHPRSSARSPARSDQCRRSWRR